MANVTCASTDETHFVGEPGCRRIGPVCPADGLPDGLPTDRPIVYVRSGATGGDGSRALPYGDLSALDLTTLAPRTVLALGVGSYDVGALMLPGGVSIVGACTMDTVLTSTLPASMEGVVTALGSGTELSQLRFADAARPALVAIGTGRSVSLDAVIVERVRTPALLFGNGATLTATDLAIRDTRPAPDGRFGRALGVESGGRAELVRAVVRDSRQVAIFSTGSASALRLEDVAVRDTRAQQSDGNGGRGVMVQRGAQGEIVRTVVERSRNYGLFVSSTGTTARFDQVLVRDTESKEADGGFGRGLGVHNGAVVEVDRALVAGNRDIGAFAADPGTRVALRDVVVRGTASRASDLTGGRGITVQSGAGLTGDRVVLERNGDIGLFAALDGSIAHVEDLVVRESLGQALDGAFGRGIGAQAEGRVEVVRAIVENNREVGIYVGQGASAQAQDIVVRDTESNVAGQFGRGLGVEDGASVELVRALLERNRSGAVYAADVGTTLAVQDLVVRDTESTEAAGLFGRGLDVENDAATRVTRALFERNRELGVVALFGATAELEDVQVLDTRQRACATDSCAGEGFGTGLGAFFDASLSALRFVVEGAPLCGVQIARNGAIDLADGEVRNCTAGACIQVDGYDLGRVMDEVRYRDNGTNLDTSELPVPEAAEPITPPGG